MKKTIRNIIILVIIFVLIPVTLQVFPFILLEIKASNNKNEITQYATIEINKGKVKVKEKVILSSKESIKYEEIPIKKSIWVNDEKKEDVYKKNQTITVLLNNKLLENSNNGKQKLKTTYYETKNGIVIEDIFTEKDKIYQIDFSYEYDAFDVVEEYKNVDLLRLGISENVQESNIRLQLPQKTNIFEIKSKAKSKIEYLGNNTYDINVKMKNSYTELLIDKGCIKNARTINEKFEENDLLRTLMKENTIILRILLIVLIITLIDFIIVLLLTKKIKIKNYYVRNPEEVIEPILAESMIDRKIGAKELIMSCIVDLINRGNINNVENEKVQLVSEKNISEYEKEIIGLLFKEKIVTFEEIKNMFIDNNEKTKEFFDKFKIIKEKIEKKLFDYNIYSKVGDAILKILRVISIIILINIPYILFLVITSWDGVTLNNFLKYNMWSIIFVLGIKKVLNKKDDFEFEGRLIKVRAVAIFLVINMIILFFNNWYKHLGTIIVIAIIFILNLIILKKSKSHVFTKTGKIEFAKVQGLKNYIIDYSLMKERKMDSVIVWDEYLAYTVAFGIPNKITKKINENLMNANIVLKKIENILKM